MNSSQSYGVKRSLFPADIGIQDSPKHLLSANKSASRNQTSNNKKNIGDAEDEKISSISQETATFSQFSQFDNELPIKTYDELIEIESKIARDKTYRSYFVQRFSSVGGKSIAAMEHITGRCNKKRNFAGLLINKIIFESVFKIKKFAASDNSTNQIEQVIKYVLIQTPFKLKRQKESTIHTTTVMEQS
ncbi:unnamed protein product [Macrosiphum euphorbiae]|uniref:DUF4806 domain-containing protein n=1 Tax=Macrosiphum euphorbiae TaxID=13131 RepID=A0AAV0Y869_9HEMI|nr:unnamed protein product [Macrosiphum euphorbiae]